MSYKLRNFAYINNRQYELQGHLLVVYVLQIKKLCLYKQLDFCSWLNMSMVESKVEKENAALKAAFSVYGHDALNHDITLMILPTRST